MIVRISTVLLSALILLGCGSSQGRQVKVYQAGERATINRLTYAVVDTQIQQRLGVEPNARIPENRFYIVSIAVSSGNNTEVPIPQLALVDDSGKVYNELADGTGVQHWLGVVRHVGAAMTERGSIVFDAPAAHYKLKLTDETDDSDAYIDLPLSFVHEQISNSLGGADGGADENAGARPDSAPTTAK